jgi:hypothetical protein
MKQLLNKAVCKSKTAALMFVLLFEVVISSCDGGVGDSCRTNEDCGSDLYCFGPNRPNVCGIGGREQCWTDTDCPMGTFCHAVWDGCSPDGIGSECRPPCTAANCGTGFRCNASGACESVPCDEGFTCPDWQACDAVAAHDASVPVHARTSGCVNILCSADTECPTGKSCVEGYCQNGLGTCAEEMLVP